MNEVSKLISTLISFSTFSAIFAQHYSPTHNGVYIQNVGYCGYLCVNKTGRVYINVMIGLTCILFKCTKYRSVYIYCVAGPAGRRLPVQHKHTATRHY